LTVRNVTLTLSMAALAVAGTAVAGGQKCEQEAKVARAMAVAEVDFELHRAQLGLVGSSLLSEGHKPAPAGTAPAAKPEPYRIAAPAERPATPVAASEPLE
jgi:hypothetical protein